MKNILRFGLILLMTTALIGCAGLEKNKADSSPQITISQVAKLDKKGVLELQGTGFAPKNEVMLLFTAEDGIQSDIGYALDPSPQTGEDGTWVTKWSYGRYVKKKLVKEGSYTLTAVDPDFNTLCEAVIEFTK